MTTNVMVRDLDLPLLNATDSRRLEVVVDGLPLFGGSQLAVDTTLVCSLHSDGSPHRGAADTDGVVFRVGLGGWRQVVTRDAHLCCSAGEGESPTGATSSCRRGPNRLGGCGGVQSSLSQQRRPSRHVSWASGAGADGDTPLSWEVEADHRHAGLAA